MKSYRMRNAGPNRRRTRYTFQAAGKP
jgi:hypothetical protein